MTESDYVILGLVGLDRGWWGCVVVVAGVSAVGVTDCVTMAAVSGETETECLVTASSWPQLGF